MFEVAAIDIPYLPQVFSRCTYRPWGAHTHALLRVWARWHGFTSTTPAPEAPATSSQYIDATESLRAHLDQLERDTLGSTWSGRDVTRGEWFALAMERKRQREQHAESAWGRLASLWLPGILPIPTPPTHYEKSETGSFKALNRLEPRHRPYP